MKASGHEGLRDRDWAWDFACRRTLSALCRRTRLFATILRHKEGSATNNNQFSQKPMMEETL